MRQVFALIWRNVDLAGLRYTVIKRSPENRLIRPVAGCLLESVTHGILDNNSNSDVLPVPLCLHTIETGGGMCRYFERMAGALRFTAVMTAAVLGVLTILASGGGTSSSTTAPVTMTLTAIVRGPSQVDLSWTAHSGPVSGYSVYRDGVAITSTIISGTSMSDYNLTPGTRYCYVVYAVVFPVGTVGTSNQACVTTEATAGWNLFNIAATSSFGSFSSLALDSAGYVHISYRTASGVAYATNSPAGTWGSYPIDPTAGAYGGTSIAVDGFGHVHVSYYDLTNNRLMYATNGTGSWTFQPIAASSGYANSIAVDAAGAVSIAYSSTYPNASLWYVTGSGGSWTSPVFVAGFGSPVASVSLAQDTSGLAHIAYAVGSGLCAIRYAAEGAAPWLDEVVQDSANCGAALALDSSNNPYVAYVAGQDLTVANRLSGNWASTVADHMPWIGGADVSIATDTQDHLYVSYQDNNADLKYATNASGSWVTLVIDATGSIGAHNSLKVDTSGKAHISYDDATNQELKYAKRP